MWAGGQPRTADITDNLSLLDSLAGSGASGITIQVTIKRGITTAVLNDNGAPITAFGASVDNFAVTRSPNWRAPPGCVVDALM